MQPATHFQLGQLIFVSTSCVTGGKQDLETAARAINEHTHVSSLSSEVRVEPAMMAAPCQSQVQPFYHCCLDHRWLTAALSLYSTYLVLQDRWDRHPEDLQMARI